MNADNQEIEVIPGKLTLVLTPDQIRLEMGAASPILSVAEARTVAAALAEAAAVLDGLNPEDHDWRRLPMQYIHFKVEADEAVKRKDRPRGLSGGVHCWIKEQTHTNAFHVACGWVTDDDWIVTEMTEHREVFRSEYEGTEYLTYYEQALLDDEVFLTELEAGDG